ncbi:MAG: peptidoglycan DD-metalloendopeptidase family protein [Peptococcaceae bacterium]|nr:peptidoglycan DD-metalloendopeptidase family protein [Peptococcaceae bacterium]
MAKPKKKRSKKLTLVIIPEAGRQIKQLAISVRLLWCAGTAFLGLLALTIFLAWHSQHLSTRVNELQELEVINRKQAQEIAQLKDKARSIEQQISELEQLEVKVRSLVGLPQRERSHTQQVSRGSRPHLSPTEQDGLRILAETNSDFNILDQAVQNKQAEMIELHQDVSERLRYLAHLPSQWPVSGHITSPFGSRRSPFGRGYEFHDGLDIAANYGQTIYAAGDGVVTFAGYLAGYGLTVSIDHGYGLVSRYCHTSRVLVRRGGQVKRGEPVARVGSSGRSTGPHLHFMVLKNGTPVNPLTYLK